MPQRRKSRSRAENYAARLRERGWTVVDVEDRGGPDPWVKIVATLRDHRLELIDALVGEADDPMWWMHVVLDGRDQVSEYDGGRFLESNFLSAIDRASEDAE